MPYEVQAIDLQAKEQKQDWFLRPESIGHIPVMVEYRGSDDFVVFESWRDFSWYLAEKVGTAFAHQRQGAIRGHAVDHVSEGRARTRDGASERVLSLRTREDAIMRLVRYQEHEVKRLLQVLNQRLATHEYLAGV